MPLRNPQKVDRSAGGWLIFGWKGKKICKKVINIEVARNGIYMDGFFLYYGTCQIEFVPYVLYVTG